MHLWLFTNTGSRQKDYETYSQSSSADSGNSSASSEGFYFPSKRILSTTLSRGTADTNTQGQAHGRVPLGLSNLDNADFSIEVSEGYKPYTRVSCDSAQFYAGNERSTSLVTAIPAETTAEGSAGTNDTATILLEKVLMAKSVAFHGTPEAISPTDSEIEALSGSSLMSSLMDGVDQLTLQELVSSSPTLGLKFLAQAKSPHVHFASPLTFVNTYTPEFDPDSGCSSGSSDSKTMGNGLQLSPQYFSLKQAIADLEKELAEMESGLLVEPKEYENDGKTRKVEPSRKFVPEKYSRNLDHVILEATKGMPLGTVENFTELMQDLTITIGRINYAMEQHTLTTKEACSVLCPHMSNQRNYIVKSKTVARNLADLGCTENNKEVTGEAVTTPLVRSSLQCSRLVLTDCGR